MGDALRAARGRLERAPIAAEDGSPHLDAEVLLRHVTGLSRGALFTYPERRLGPCERARLEVLLERREAGEPVAYLTGEREFMGLPFRVDRGVLLPRPETESLVERALQLLAEGDDALEVRVADVGTGSGAIAVSLAALAPAGRRLRVFASDVSPEALQIARGNAVRLVPADREGVRFVRCSLLAGLRGPFVLVLANLPYVPSGEIAGLAYPVAGYEPRLALDGGPDGLDVYRGLLADLAEKLAPGGTVLLECDPRQAPALSALLAGALPGATVIVRPDLAGRDRVVEGRRLPAAS